jgi:signal transduction histidine kinase/ActR/RegA family two-component response regulator
MQDITDRKRTEAERDLLLLLEQQARKHAEQTAERITQLQSVTASLAEDLTPSQIASVVITSGVSALGANAGIVSVLNQEGTELSVLHVMGYFQTIIDAGFSYPANSATPIADSISLRSPIIIETLAEWEQRYPQFNERLTIGGNGALAAFPLIVDQKVLGGFELSFSNARNLTQNDQDFILALTQQCAQALERSQLYKAERIAREQAESANRVKDEFLAVLSHELRTPLNPILGWARLLRSRTFSPAKTSQALEPIERNALIQTQLIEDLLDVSRILQGKLSLNKATINLESTIRAALETVRLSAEAKAITIQTTYTAGVGQVSGDGNRLQQVMWNLLSNAVKFTPSGGTVKVHLTQIDAYAQIQITDTGKGINPDFLPHVFDYFRQADSATTRKFGGLDLGLAIVRQIIELHGGTIAATSPGEEQGATFTIQIPIIAPTELEEAIVEDNLFSNESLSNSLSGLKILVVDDERDSREYVAFVLEDQGATVVMAANAKEALEIYEQSPPDFLISDIGMPDMDGYALMREIRTRLAGQNLSGTSEKLIPALALTAYAGECDEQQAIASGFQRHLSKPVDPAELIRLVVDLGACN